MAKRMTPEEKAQRAEAREAARKAQRDEHIQKLLADWPPLTLDQAHKLRVLLYPNHKHPAADRGPTPHEIEPRRKQREREDALAAAKKLAESLTACDVCDIQPEQHYYAQRGAIDMHEWQPGRAEKIMKGKA